MAHRPKVDEAFQDEVLDLLHDGFPAPDRHYGPLYKGNGGQAASAALAAEMKDHIKSIDADANAASDSQAG